MNDNNKSSTLDKDTKIEEITGPDVMAEIENLKEEIAKLRQGEVPIYKEDLDNNTIIFIRTMDVVGKEKTTRKIVVGWDKEMKRHVNSSGEYADTITLHLMDDKDEVEKRDFDYMDFVRNSRRVKTIVLDKTVKTRIDFQGYTTKKYVKNYSYIDTGVKVPMKVETPEVTYKLKIKEGDFAKREVTILEEYLN